MKIAVLGAGAWGTALAAVAAKAGRDVTLWAFEPEVVAVINGQHRNPVFLPDVILDPRIAATGDLAQAANAIRCHSSPAFRVLAILRSVRRTSCQSRFSSTAATKLSSTRTVLFEFCPETVR